ncbi:hypothetical protein [Fibrisoma limi]|uniref:hypothetical protein n=1 Tax=Fibrisoma limi TaxID=663275 RepID=UPI000586C953|nr:hypothetical protein [Fibrisoma limi]
MKIFLFLLLILSVCANGQSILPDKPKNSVSFGVNYLKLDAPDATGPHFQFAYTRFITAYKLAVSISSGYFESNNRINIANDYYVNSNFRRRITGDLTVAFTPIRTAKNLVTIGLGPSLWHRTDKTYQRIDYTLTPDGEVTNLLVDGNYVKKIDAGFHAKATYSHTVTRRLVASGQVALTRFKELSVIPMIGINIGYKL